MVKSNLWTVALDDIFKCLLLSDQSTKTKGVIIVVMNDTVVSSLSVNN